jgi:predicted metal-dependent peptidase
MSTFAMRLGEGPGEDKLAAFENRLKINMVRLLTNQPFFGYFLVDMVRMRRDDLPAAFGVTVKNGRPVLYYRPSLADVCSESELRASLVHEVCHLICDHIPRRGNRGAVVMTGMGPVSLWNIAADLSINQYIEGLPSWAVSLAGFPSFPEGQSAERYYELLLEMVDSCSDHGASGGRQDSVAGAGRGGEGIGCRCKLPAVHHVEWEEAIEGGANPQLVKEVVRVKARQAMEMAKARNMWGRVPGRIQELVEELLAAQVPWEREFRNFHGSLVAKGVEPTRSRPNRRYGFDAPGSRPAYTGKLAVFVDTSGSVSSALLRRFISEVKGAARHLEVVVVEIDAQINRVYRFARRLPGGAVVGRGDTVFDEAFDILCSGRFPVREGFDPKWRGLLSGLKGAVFLTDGEVVVKHSEPRLPVLWVVPEWAEPPVAWGRRIKLAERAG